MATSPAGGRPLHKDPRTALTDHAAVLVTISDK